jgi:hypothetical protein
MERIVFLCLVLAANALEPAIFTLSTMGNQFEAANSVELLATLSNTRIVGNCAMSCYLNIQCRTFDFNSNSQECRLFEGSVDTGTLLSTSSPTVVGWINIDSSVYNLYNASSDECLNNQFLYSDTLSGLCECPINTFWNGSMCLNQRYAGEACENNNWCRTGLFLNCISSVCIGKKYLL